MLLAGSAGAAAADQRPGATIAYVLTNMSWAMQSTPGAAECPQGLNEGTREQFKQLFPDNGSKRSFESTQLRREIDGFHPTTAVEPFVFREGQGPVAPGLDLDGIAGAEDFRGPDGRTGIDNQMHRVLGCIANYRAPDGPIRFFEDEMVLRENYNRVVVQLSGVDSLVDDDAVEVRIFRGRDKVLVDAGGLKAVPGGTQRVDLRWGANYIRETRGRIAGGVLRTEPVDLLYPWDVFWLPSDQYMYQARLELSLSATTATGLIGGYVDIDTWYLHTAKNWGTHYQSYGNSSAPSIYKAMRRLADGEPDPQTGQKRAISGALATVFTQVNVIAPEPAAYAEALARRRLGVRYRGMPAERGADEERFDSPAAPAIAAAHGGAR
jgi:hypothetical protein